MLTPSLLFIVPESEIIVNLVSHESFITFDAINAEQRTFPSWLTVSFSLFFIGVTGIVYNWKTFLVVMMCIEIMYLGSITGFVLCGVVLHDTVAEIYALLILIFAACESAVGLGLLVVARSYRDTLAVMRDTLGG